VNRRKSFLTVMDWHCSRNDNKKAARRVGGEEERKGVYCLMSDRENYSISPGIREGLCSDEDKDFRDAREAIRACLGYDIEIQVFQNVRGLIIDYHAVRYTQGSIYSTFVAWVLGAAREKVSVWSYGQKEIAHVELEKRIDAEASTCEERWRRKEKELRIPPRKDKDNLFAVLNDVGWLESRTRHRDEEVHRLSIERMEAMRRKCTMAELDRIEKKLKMAALKAREKLQLELQGCWQKILSNTHVIPIVRHIQPCARAASRARHSAPRQTFAGSGGGGDSDDGDSDCSDPPEQPHPVTFHLIRSKRPNNSPHPWRTLGFLCMAERRHAA
jgi:hypothetical protein